MEYIIRKCEEKDLSELVELCEKHSEFEQANYSAIGKQVLLKNAIFADKPQLHCFVIESKGKLEGYFTYTFDFSTWDAQTFIYLDCLYLEPDFRGFGIGEIVFEKLKTIAQQSNCVNIQWQTPIFNERAIKFYNRIGGIGKEKVRFFIDLQISK
jgi:GNAT superfamily N-acetyltransferase